MRITTLCLLIFGSLMISACGGDNNSDIVFNQIVETETIYQVDDLKSLGIKKGKTYKVEGLNKATDAIFAFYKKPGAKEAKEYEIRFYENHNDAIEFGISMAKERVGPDAKLKKQDATWDAGLTDARQCGGSGGGVSVGGVGAAGDHGVGSCSSPKYNEFFVQGNMVILCQGENEIESRIQCTNLMAIIP